MSTGELQIQRGLLNTFVLVGAGASFDCDDPDLPNPGGDRMPLVKQLFNPNSILHKYGAVSTMASDLRHEISGDKPAASVEEFLRRTLREGKLFEQKQARLVPLYLQHRIAVLSDHWANYSDNYGRLVNQVRRASRECAFVSLNYDTLLDQHLNGGPITSIVQYSQDDWLLAKPHGSVNWGSPFFEDLPDKYKSFTVRQMIEEFGDDIQKWFEINVQVVTDHLNLEDHTVNRQGTLHYPTIAVPLGAEDDDLIWPPEQERNLRVWLHHRKIHMLVIGYSGLDRKVLEFIRDTKPYIASILIVNKDDDEIPRTLECAQALAEVFDLFVDFMNVKNNKGFGAFVGDPLADHLRGLAGTA